MQARARFDSPRRLQPANGNVGSEPDFRHFGRTTGARDARCRQLRRSSEAPLARLVIRGRRHSRWRGRGTREGASGCGASGIIESARAARPRANSPCVLLHPSRIGAGRSHAIARRMKSTTRDSSPTRRRALKSDDCFIDSLAAGAVQPRWTNVGPAEPVEEAGLRGNWRSVERRCQRTSVRVPERTRAHAGVGGHCRERVAATTACLHTAGVTGSNPVPPTTTSP